MTKFDPTKTRKQRMLELAIEGLTARQIAEAIAKEGYAQTTADSARHILQRMPEYREHRSKQMLTQKQRPRPEAKAAMTKALYAARNAKIIEYARVNFLASSTKIAQALGVSICVVEKTLAKALVSSEVRKKRKAAKAVVLAHHAKGASAESIAKNHGYQVDFVKQICAAHDSRKESDRLRNRCGRKSPKNAATALPAARKAKKRVELPPLPRTRPWSATKASDFGAYWTKERCDMYRSGTLIAHHAAARIDWLMSLRRVEVVRRYGVRRECRKAYFQRV